MNIGLATGVRGRRARHRPHRHRRGGHRRHHAGCTTAGGPVVRHRRRGQVAPVPGADRDRAAASASSSTATTSVSAALTDHATVPTRRRRPLRVDHPPSQSLPNSIGHRGLDHDSWPLIPATPDRPETEQVDSLPTRGTAGRRPACSARWPPPSKGNATRCCTGARRGSARTSPPARSTRATALAALDQLAVVAERAGLGRPRGRRHDPLRVPTVTRFDDLGDGTAPHARPSDEREPAVDVGGVDLTDAARRRDIDPATMFTRTDGIGLLYPGRVHWFQGESESLKSWAAQGAAVEVLAAGGNVLYIDYEDDDRGIVARLLALGVDKRRARRPGPVPLPAPDEPLADAKGTTGRHMAELERHLEHPWQLAIVDGVTEAMTTEGAVELIDNTDVAIWQRRLPEAHRRHRRRRRLRRPHRQERDAGRFAIGGQHKLAGVTGATYKFTVTKRLRRAAHRPDHRARHDHRREGPARLGARPRRGRRRHHRRVRGDRLARRRRHRQPARPRRRRQRTRVGAARRDPRLPRRLRRRLQERHRDSVPGRAEAVRAALAGSSSRNGSPSPRRRVPPSLAHRPRPGTLEGRDEVIPAHPRSAGSVRPRPSSHIDEVGRGTKGKSNLVRTRWDEWTNGGPMNP